MELLRIFKYLFSIQHDAPRTNRYVITSDIRKHIIDMINEQSDLEDNGFIFMKINHLCDTEIISALNTAVANNVKVRILVRTSFDYTILNYTELRPLRPNIIVKSKVGRFLEHDRVFIFGDDVYIASCDMLQRNLDKRTEILFRIPSLIQSERIKRSFLDLFDDKSCYYNEDEPPVNLTITRTGEMCIYE